MRIAYSSNAFTNTTLQQAIDVIARRGYDGVEILCDRPHWFPGEVDDEALRRVREALSRHALGISNLNVNTANGFFEPLPPENVFEPSLSSRNRVWRNWRVVYSCRALKLARRIGADCISVTSGRPGSGGAPEQGLELFVDSLKRICIEAERLRIRVGIEYEPGLLIERAAEVAEVIDRVGSDWLGANLDIGHAWLAGDDPQHCIERLGGRIWNVHVEDIAGKKHYHRVPGAGDLPIGDYIGALHRSGYEGFLTVELYEDTTDPEGAGRAALAHLRPLVQQIVHHG